MGCIFKFLKFIFYLVIILGFWYAWVFSGDKRVYLAYLVVLFLIIARYIYKASKK